jgi:hypothetical protein
MPSYWFFFPIILAWCLLYFGIDDSWLLIMVVSTFAAWIFAQGIIQYVHLSIYPFYALYLMLCMGFFVWLGTVFLHYQAIGWISLSFAQNLMFVFVIIANGMPTVYRIRNSDFSLTWLLHMVWFAIFVYGMSWIVSSEVLFNFFLEYNRYVWIFVGLTMIFSYYSGLQVFEIIRFRRLIWKNTKKK